MTQEQKQFILMSHQKGISYAEIARALGLSPNTVKSVCTRNKPLPSEPVAVSDTACRQCGAPLEQTPHRREKRFCSDQCRLAWWHAHRDQEKNAEPHICPTCGTAFTAAANRKYCSHGCYIKARYV